MCIVCNTRSIIHLEQYRHNIQISIPEMMAMSKLHRKKAAKEVTTSVKKKHLQKAFSSFTKKHLQMAICFILGISFQNYVNFQFFLDDHELQIAGDTQDEMKLDLDSDATTTLTAGIILGGQKNAATSASSSAKGRSTSTKALFNPFHDIKLSYSEITDDASYTSDESNAIYSSHQCVSSVEQDAFDDHLIDKARLVTRTCKYQNLYYSPSDQKFHYFASPQEQLAFTDVTSSSPGLNATQMVEDMTISLGNVFHHHAKNRILIPRRGIWHPTVHIGSHTYSNEEGDTIVEIKGNNDTKKTYNRPPFKYATIASPQNLALLMFRPFYSFNLGHFLWDDALSLFTMLDIFGMTDSAAGAGAGTGTGADHSNKKSEKKYASDGNMISNHNGDDANANGEEPLFPLPFYMQNSKIDSYFRCTADSDLYEAQQRWKVCTKVYHKLFPPVFRYETDETGDILRSGNWLKGMTNLIGFQNASQTISTRDGTSNIINAGGTEDAVQLNRTESSSSSARHLDSSSQVRLEGMNYLASHTKYVLVPTVLAGTGKHGQVSCGGDCAIGRASQLYSFREYVLGNIFWPNYSTIKKEKKIPAGYITFSLPVGSSRPKEAWMFKNIIEVATQIFGEDKIKVVDMATLTMKEEALLAMDTAVLFANHGGGSATSVFLPRDASIFLYTTGKCSRKAMHWCDQGLQHFDSIFYNSAGYIRPTWLETSDRFNMQRLQNLLRLEYEKTMAAWSMRNVGGGAASLLRGGK